MIARKRFFSRAAHELGNSARACSQLVLALRNIKMRVFSLLFRLCLPLLKLGWKGADFKGLDADSAVFGASTMWGLSEGLVVLDARKRVVFANRHYAELTGFAPSELRGREVDFFGMGYSSTELEMDLWDVLSVENAWRGITWTHHRTGSVVRLHAAITLCRDSQGVKTNYLAVVSDLEDKKVAEERIAERLSSDRVTGLLGWSQFSREVSDVLERSTLSSLARPFAFLLVDIDRFGRVVAKLGRHDSDSILREIGERLGRLIERGGHLSRRDADVFCLAGVQEINVPDFAERVKEAIQAPFLLDGEELILSATIGVAFAPRDGVSFDRLLASAESALRAGKRAGRDRVVLYDPNAMRFDDELIIERDLHHALERKELVLNFQPKIDLKSGVIDGGEVLLRWNHPKYGLISPAKFIPIAEETGLIVPIGAWVAVEAISLLTKWNAERRRGAKLAVNLSARQFSDKALLDEICRAYTKRNLPFGTLELELTESLLIDNPGKTAAILQGIKDAGISISIDDFGTGYSSLNYLKRYPIDCLKIDQSFIRELSSSSDEAIVRAIIALARTLDMATVAEGVENENQLRFLVDQGCSLAQGYLFSKPVGLSVYEELLSQPFFSPDQLQLKAMGI